MRYKWNKFSFPLRVQVIEVQTSLQMKTNYVSKLFILSLSTSENQCQKISLGLLTCVNVQLKPLFLTVHRVKLTYTHKNE